MRATLYKHWLQFIDTCYELQHIGISQWDIGNEYINRQQHKP